MIIPCVLKKFTNLFNGIMYVYIKDENLIVGKLFQDSERNNAMVFLLIQTYILTLSEFININCGLQKKKIYLRLSIVICSN